MIENMTLPAVMEGRMLEEVPRTLEAVQRPMMAPLPPLGEMRQVAELLARSGFFKDVKDEAQAFAKMLRGWELGIGYATALSEIDIIQGKPVLSSALCARLIKQSGKYNYRVVTATKDECELEFYERGEPVGRTKFTIEDAKLAGLDKKQGSNYGAYAEDMLFWRAMSRGAKRFCADVFGGSVYVEGEIPPERPAPSVDRETGEILEPPAALTAGAPQSPTSAVQPPVVDRPTPEQHGRYLILKERADALGVSIEEHRPTRGLTWQQVEDRLALIQATVDATEDRAKEAPEAEQVSA
jgi:hypothetical protein